MCAAQWVGKQDPHFFPVPRLENPQALPAGREGGGWGAHSTGVSFQNWELAVPGNQPLLPMAHARCFHCC